MLSPSEVQTRRSFFEITEDDLQRLASLRGLAEAHCDEIVESLYDLLLRHPDTRTFLPDDDTVARLKRTQRAYFLGLFDGRCDAAYAEDRLHVGRTHERIGLPTTWYVGAYGRYLRLLLDRFFAKLTPAQAVPAYQSLTKLILFDMALAVDSYLIASVEAVRRQQATMRELATPVVGVHEGVLLLPLIGALDARRAAQVTETVLTRIVEAAAKVIVIDIAGVPTIDAYVAEHLLQTAAAAQLLGTVTILTGITANVARTLVRLGVDLSTLHTRAQLADGLALALHLVGRAIVRASPQSLA